MDLTQCHSLCSENGSENDVANQNGSDIKGNYHYDP